MSAVISLFNRPTWLKSGIYRQKTIGICVDTYASEKRSILVNYQCRTIPAPRPLRKKPIGSGEQVSPRVSTIACLYCQPVELQHTSA